MLIISDKLNKMMDVVDIYIKPIKPNKDKPEEVTGYMLMGVPVGVPKGQILGVYDSYEEAQKVLVKVADKVGAYRIKDFE